MAEGSLLDLHIIVKYVHILKEVYKDLAEGDKRDQIPSEDEEKWKKDECSNDIVIEDRDIEDQSS